VASVVVCALVLAVLVGALLRVHSQSVGYERAINRSYAAQARLFAEQSDELGREFDTVLAGMPRDGRTALEEALDTLVRSSDSLARWAATAASPAPSGGAGADVAAAMADRSDAMQTLRTAVDRLLGMSPLPVVGAPDPSSVAATPPLLSAAGAAAQLAKVGELLTQGDRMYAAGRRALRTAPGHARVPASVWSVRTAAWTSTGTLSVVDALTSSPTLAAVRRVELVAHALALTPAPVPSAGTGTASGISVLPPTGHIEIGVVVANDGNVAERGIVVRATVARAGTSAHPGRARRLSLTAHSSASVTLPPVPVVPGNSYTLVVSVDPPLANVAGTVTSDTVPVRIAPPGPPTVAQLLPPEGSVRGGTAVAILGSGFTWVSGVTFGGVRARFKVVSSTEVTAVAPAGTGTVAVHVTNPGGASAATTDDRFHYRREVAAR
jgi:hypothetical protein